MSETFFDGRSEIKGMEGEKRKRNRREKGVMLEGGEGSNKLFLHFKAA